MARKELHKSNSFRKYHWIYSLRKSVRNRYYSVSLRKIVFLVLFTFTSLHLVDPTKILENAQNVLKTCLNWFLENFMKWFSKWIFPIKRFLVIWWFRSEFEVNSKLSEYSQKNDFWWFRSNRKCQKNTTIGSGQKC